MKIKLIQATKNAGELIADIASICYGKEKANNPDKLLKHLFELKHDSVFEHIYYTFKIEKISRACLSQLTRHRHTSFTVRSSRYCNEKKQPLVIPQEILNDALACKEWFDSVKQAKSSYDTMIERGIKREDARFILPQALSTDLYMSCNLRELIHMHAVRATNKAQWEIRELVEEMVELVIKHSPELKFMFKGEN